MIDQKSYFKIYAAKILETLDAHFPVTCDISPAEMVDAETPNSYEAPDCSESAYNKERRSLEEYIILSTSIPMPHPNDEDIANMAREMSKRSFQLNNFPDFNSWAASCWKKNLEYETDLDSTKKTHEAHIKILLGTAKYMNSLGFISYKEANDTSIHEVMLSPSTLEKLRGPVEINIDTLQGFHSSIPIKESGFIAIDLLKSTLTMAKDIGVQVAAAVISETLNKSIGLKY